MWKIIGVLLLVWLAFLMVGAIFKLVVPMLVVGALILGTVLLYRGREGNRQDPAVVRFRASGAVRERRCPGCRARILW